MRIITELLLDEAQWQSPRRKKQLEQMKEYLANAVAGAVEQVVWYRESDESDHPDYEVSLRVVETDDEALQPDPILEATLHAQDRLAWIIENRHLRVQGTDERGWSVLDCSNGLTFLVEKADSYVEAIDEAMKLRPLSVEGSLSAWPRR